MEDITHKGIKIKIEQDQDAESPRNWDNLGTMVCFHRRYDLGDKDHGYDSDDYNGWAAMEKAIRAKEDAALILPLYLYDHSGLRMKIGSFQGLLPQGHAEFDSGQVGFVFVSKKKVREEYNVKRITKKTLEKAYEVLKSEVNAYDQFLSGDVWGYIVEEDEDGNELPSSLHESCWGFFGYDYCVEQAKEVAERLAPKVEFNKEVGEKYGDGAGQAELPFEAPALA